MAYRGSFYYDEFDYENYPESLEYEGHNEDEHQLTFIDAVNCGFSVAVQISIQLFSLLCVNFVYRLIRNASKIII